MPQTSKLNTSNLNESETVEFKLKPVNLEKEIVAFANARGGVIYIGLDDSGNAHPIELNNRIRSQIVNAVRNCDPMPEFSLEEREGIVLISIPSGPNKPYRAPDGFYMRLGATSQKLTRDQIMQFAIRENRIQFDSQIHSWTSGAIPKDLFSTKKFRRFRELSGLNSHVADIDLLSNLNLLKKDGERLGITNALILLFGEEVAAIFPQARTIAWIMKNETEILKQFLIEGDLFHQLTEALAFVEAYLERSYDIKGLQRSEKAEIPRAVLRELIVNALAHRDYFETGAEVQIKIFPNRLQIANPSSLPKETKVTSLFGLSIRRNPIIAESFQRAGITERAGTGLLRINQLLQESGLTGLQISIEGPFFIAEVNRLPIFSKYKGLSERKQNIIRQIGMHKQMTSRELALALKTTERTIRNDLSELIEANYLERKKSGRSVYYYLVVQYPVA